MQVKSKINLIVMSIIFFLVITPVSLIMKIFGKKTLNVTFNKNKKSYWINRSKETNSMRKQF
jgi:hypothetical protein